MKVKSGIILIAVILILYSSAVTTVNVADCVTNPTSKVSIDIDVVGVPGPEGPNGDQGPRGYPGDTSQCGKIKEAEQTEQISSELNDLINSTFTKCGIYSLNWRRVTYIDTTQGAACPDGLREVTNSALNKRACGRTVNVGCSPLTIPSGGSYTHVCGRARGYQIRSTDGFRRHGGGTTINDTYVDGLSITRGSPRKHIWSYAAGPRGCQCDPVTSGHSGPGFVGNDYCFDKSLDGTEWEVPLWDGEVCTQPKNESSGWRSGWFHKEVNLTRDDIEVRWCCDESREGNEDVYTDIVEIWVL